MPPLAHQLYQLPRPSTKQTCWTVLVPDPRWGWRLLHFSLFGKCQRTSNAHSKKNFHYPQHSLQTKHPQVMRLVKCPLCRVARALRSFETSGPRPPCPQRLPLPRDLRALSPPLSIPRWLLLDFQNPWPPKGGNFRGLRNLGITREKPKQSLHGGYSISSKSS